MQRAAAPPERLGVDLEEFVPAAGPPTGIWIVTVLHEDIDDRLAGDVVDLPVNITPAYYQRLGQAPYRMEATVN